MGFTFGSSEVFIHHLRIHSVKNNVKLEFVHFQIEDYKNIFYISNRKRRMKLPGSGLERSRDLDTYRRHKQHKNHTSINAEKRDK